MEKIFPNGFISWRETYGLTLMLFQGLEAKLEPFTQQYGQLSLLELAAQITDNFEQDNLGRFWDGEWEEELEQYINTYLNNYIN